MTIKMLKKHLNFTDYSKGDTIVEVMVVLAILGLAIGISYATANTGLQQSRNAEEHSEALGLINNQVELLRADIFSNGTLPPTTNDQVFCMNGTTPVITNFPANESTLNASNDNFGVYPSTCQSQGSGSTFNYYTSVFYDTASGAYDFRIRWDGLGDLGRQQEELNYRIEPASVSTPQYITVNPPAQPTPGWVWSIDGTYYDGNNDPLSLGFNPNYDAVHSCMAGDYVNNEDTLGWLATNEDGCDPPGGLNTANTLSCFGYTDHGKFSINTPVTPDTSVYGRRDFTATYDFAHGTLTTTPTTGVTMLSSQPVTAYLFLNYQQYPGAGDANGNGDSDIAPVLGYDSILAGTTPQDIPNYPYMYVVYVYVMTGSSAASSSPNLASGVKTLLQPSAGTGFSPTQQGDVFDSPQQPEPYKITLPPNATGIQVSWVNNEEDQKGTGICTANAAGYDPDFQLNDVELSSSPIPGG